MNMDSYFLGYCDVGKEHWTYVDITFIGGNYGTINQFLSHDEIWPNVLVLLLRP